jgi:hypothetical protein
MRYFTGPAAMALCLLASVPAATKTFAMPRSAATVQTEAADTRPISDSQMSARQDIQTRFQDYRRRFVAAVERHNDLMARIDQAGEGAPTRLVTLGLIDEIDDLLDDYAHLRDEALQLLQADVSSLTPKQQADYAAYFNQKIREIDEGTLSLFKTRRTMGGDYLKPGMS